MLWNERVLEREHRFALWNISHALHLPSSFLVDLVVDFMDGVKLAAVGAVAPCPAKLANSIRWNSQNRPT